MNNRFNPGPSDTNTYGVGAPVNYNMGSGVLGSYSNLRLKTPCRQNWKKPPCNPPIISNKQISISNTTISINTSTCYQ